MAFKHISVDKPGTKTRNPAQGHAESAYMRQNSSNAIMHAIYQVGYVPYNIGMSNRDAGAGNRHFFWMKDLSIEYRDNPKTEKSYNVLIDVDYYVDMASLLLEGRPCALYTFVPSSPGDVQRDYSYTFTSATKVKFTPSNAEPYEHELWDWSNDTIYVTDGLRTVVYDVRRIRVEENHQIVTLEPIYNGPTCLVSGLRGVQLTRLRLELEDGNTVVAMERSGKGEVTYALGALGAYAHVSIPARDFGLIRMNTCENVTVQRVLSQVKEMTKEEGQLVASLLAKLNKEHPLITRITVPPMYHYRTQPFESKKQMMHPLGNPIAHPAYAPESCTSNQKRSRDERIEKLKHAVELTSERIAFLEETPLLLYGDARLHPVSIHEVRERQHRPSQRSILDQAEKLDNCSGPQKGFLKAEAYSQDKDPRSIGTVHPDHKYEWSQFTYAMQEELKKHAWYAFKTPKVVAGRIGEILGKSQFVADIDAHRYDGQQNNYSAEHEARDYYVAFDERYHDKLRELIPRNTNADGIYTPVFDEEVVRVNQGYTRSSGNPNTSNGNTANGVKALMRSCVEEGMSLRDSVAYVEDKALVGGDDMFIGDVSEESIRKGFELMGFERGLKVNIYNYENTAMKYLARYWDLSGLGSGDHVPQSMCDLNRQLPKFFMTTSKLNEDQKKARLVEKAMSFNLTDGNTPIIGPLCKKILELGNGIVSEPSWTTWWGQYKAEDQFPNLNHGNWMNQVISEVYPEFDATAFERWLEGCESLEDIMACPYPFDEKPEVAHVSIVNEEPSDHTGQQKLWTWLHWLTTEQTFDHIVYVGSGGPNDEANRKLMEYLPSVTMTLIDPAYKTCPRKYRDGINVVAAAAYPKNIVSLIKKDIAGKKWIFISDMLIAQTRDGEVIPRWSRTCKIHVEMVDKLVKLENPPSLISLKCCVTDELDGQVWILPQMCQQERRATMILEDGKYRPSPTQEVVCTPA